ncbi:long-chain fatty acid--CoA ligase [Actinomadura sp. WMMA1423]|uniref:acyl-CoA synthetase n=1 Tax=Actinomadura sp. WMMA1423 TaxID=2591108 RepID=UPI001146DFA7|nr:long-chain fatty acid--CoA ligase [Actinomadura sp. WMMA1423]
MLNLGTGSWPARRARRAPDRVALRHRDREITYGEVSERSTRLAHALAGLGVQSGARVAYLGRNHPAFVESMFAAHLLGAIFVPLSFRLAAPELDYMLGQSGAEVLIHAPECDTAVGGLVSYTGARVPLASAYEGLLAGGATEPIDVPLGLDDPALVLYTSGTTGLPKGTVLTHGNLAFNTLNMFVDVDIREDEVALVAAPLFHVAALNQLLLPTFMKGGTSVLMDGWDVDGCLDAIERHGVTWVFGVAAMFAGLARSPRWDAADLSSLRHVMSGGAPIPTSLIHRYQERGIVFCQGYGLTETAPGATFLGADGSVEKAGSAGTPCFFADVKVVRPDLSEAAPGEPGEVLISGPSVTPGYWDAPEATAAAFTADGWFRSGDVAFRDEDGHLTIVDRLKDMYISGGENVYPAEAEAVAAGHPAVAECAVVGVPDEKWGEAGAAFVVVRPGASLAPDDFRAFLRERLASYKVPGHVHLVEQLPRTGSGKVRKSTLRARYAATSGEPEGQRTTEP